jgi:hypothetical protein
VQKQEIAALKAMLKSNESIGDDGVDGDDDVESNDDASIPSAAAAAPTDFSSRCASRLTTRPSPSPLIGVCLCLVSRKTKG